MTILKNPKHERFAQLLAQGKTATEAYETVGYKPNRQHGARLATNGDIQARVAELQQRVAEGVVISRQWVLERLIENANRAMQAAAVKDAEGNTIGEYRYEGSVANKALELLGKELGMFVERRKVDVTTHPELLSDSDLADIVSGDRGQDTAETPRNPSKFN